MSMRVALYARYSSEGRREASIDDQFRTCQQYVGRQDGWTITARYQDQAISGTPHNLLLTGEGIV